MQSIGISQENLRKINSVIYRFIWNPRAKKGKKVTEKIKREILNKDYANGGLKMIDMNKFQDSFLLKWADRLLNSSNDSWKIIPFIYYKKVGGISAFLADVKGSNFKGLNLIKSSFWKKVLSTWLNYKYHDQYTISFIPSIYDPIFNNSLIIFKRNTLFNSRCIDKDMYYIKDFLNNEGNIMSFTDFNTIFDNSADSLLIYNTIFNSLNKFKEEFKQEFQNNINNGENTSSDTVLCLFRGLEVGRINRKTFYNLISDTKTESIKEAWRNTYHLNAEDPSIWCVSRECCSETKLLELQWKILHGIYPTGVLLYKMKIKCNDLCDFCGEIDSISHFFVSCRIIVPVWEEANKVISSYIGKSFTLSERDKIIGILSSDYDFENESRTKVNKIILVCKKVISKFKYEKAGNIRLLLENQLSFRGLL